VSAHCLVINPTTRKTGGKPWLPHKHLNRNNAKALTLKAPKALPRDRLAERAATAEGNLRGAASQSAETLAEQRERLAQELETNTEKARLMIAKHPLATAGAAFAAGVVITAMLRRR